MLKILLLCFFCGHRVDILGCYCWSCQRFRHLISAALETCITPTGHLFRQQRVPGTKQRALAAAGDV